MLHRLFSYVQPMPKNNMFQPLSITLNIIPKSPTFFTDDYIEGEVELTSTTPIIINDINLVLSTMEQWYTFSKEMNTNINEKNNQIFPPVSLDVKRKLNINTDLVALKEGKYIFGFKFKIPLKLEPSFEFPSKEGIAYYRYVLSANIISPNITGNSSIYIILKSRQKIEMNKQIIFSVENNIHKWLLDGGKTKMTITSLNGTNNFKFGEKINFNIYIDNTKGKLRATKCKVVLTRIVSFKTKSSEVRKVLNDEIISKEVNTDTLPGETKSFDSNINLEDIDNKSFDIKTAGIPYKNINKINSFLPTMKTLLLECSYMLKFTLDFDTFFTYNDRPIVTMEIILCHQSFEEYKNEMDQKMNMNNNLQQPNNNIRYSNIIPQPNNNMVYPNLPPSNNMIPMINNNVIPTPLNKRAMTFQLRNVDSFNQFNQINDNMNNNNIMNNNQDEDLPSIDEVEGNKFNNYNKPNFDNNYNNNFGNNTFGNNYVNDHFDNNNDNNNNNCVNKTFGNIKDSNNNINNSGNNTFGNQIINSDDNNNKKEINENDEDNNPPPLPSFPENNGN